MTKEGNYGSPEEQMRIVFFFPGDIFFLYLIKIFYSPVFMNLIEKKQPFFHQIKSHEHRRLNNLDPI